MYGCLPRLDLEPYRRSGGPYTLDFVGLVLGLDLLVLALVAFAIASDRLCRHGSRVGRRGGRGYRGRPGGGWGRDDVIVVRRRGLGGYLPGFGDYWLATLRVVL